MESLEFIGKQEVTPSNSYLQGKKIGDILNWAKLREDALSLRVPDKRAINQIGSYPYGLSIAEIPDDADQNDFLKGLRDAMERTFTDGYFIVEYSHNEQVKILEGVDPSSLKQQTVFFNVEEFQKTSG